jgi:hypothetical protein
LQDNQVLRRSLTHVPMTANISRRSVRLQLRTIESVSELSASVKGLDLPSDVDAPFDHDDNKLLTDRRANVAPNHHLIPQPLDCDRLHDVPLSPTFSGLKECCHDDSLSSLTMPSPTTMVRELSCCLLCCDVLNQLLIILTSLTYVFCLIRASKPSGATYAAGHVSHLV